MTNKDGNRPFRLEVSFPLMHEPSEISEVELYRLINYLRRMSNDDYTFDFKAPSYLRVKSK